MAQDAGAASCAPFVEQAEAAVADSTVPRHAARASRKVPGMRRARNMAGPALRRVSSTCSTIILARLFHVASAKFGIWIVLSEFAHNALIGESSAESAGWIRKKPEVNGGPSRNLRPPRWLKPAQRPHLTKVDADFLPMMLAGSLESALPVALLVRAEQLLRTHDEAGDDPTMALTRARHLTTARGLGLRQSPPGCRPENAPASGGETRPEREPRDV